MNYLSDTETYLFYSCSIISFLESRVDTYVENLEPFFHCDPSAKKWLQNVWLPEEQEHGKLMRSYVEEQWPDYQWNLGFKEFSKIYIPQCATEKLRRSIGLEALARCVTETEAAMIYRCLADYSNDPKLSKLLTRMSIDEVRHYREFRNLHRRSELVSKNSFMSKAKVLLDRSELVRDEDIALAFVPLNQHWKCNPPFQPWSYKKYLGFTAGIMKDYFQFKEAKRMMFHPIKTGGFINKLMIDILAVLAARQFMRYI
jgi:hypothetical protein